MENNKNDKSIIKIIDTAKRLSKKQKDSIVDIIYENLVRKNKGKYLEVKVKSVNKIDGKPNFYIAYLAHSETYTFDVLKFNIRENELTEIEWDFDEDEDSEETEDEDNSKNPTQPPEDLTEPAIEPEIQFVVGTAFDQVATAVEAVNNIAEYAKLAKLNVVTLIGEEATVAAYKKYLASPSVMAFCNIGHGNKQGIMLTDGSLTYKWFNSLKNELRPTVIYFNSCITYNNPLWQSIMTHGTRTYIAGKIKLKIGISEQITSSFWLEVLNEKNKMLATVNEGNLVEPLKVNFGLAGDGGVF